MNGLERLTDIVSKFDRIAIAYSGGVDSTFLLYFTKIIAKRDVLAITAVSDTYTDDELKFAKSFTGKIGVPHILIKTDEFEDKRFVKNPENRCFYCKYELFSKIESLKGRLGFDVVFDGTNYSDRTDFRPGNLAKKRFGVVSPLELAKITKEDIRGYSKKYRITGYNRPSNACLASRIPYGISLDREILKKIAVIERFLKKLGIEVVRLRHHGTIARIETSVQDLRKVLINRDKIVKRIKRYGYRYVTVDIEGYRTGSLNIR